MTKRILRTILSLIVLIGGLAGIKALQIRRMIDQGAKFVPPPVTVTVAQVQADSWESIIAAAGSLTAVQGVTMAAEMPGKVVHIAFESDTMVRAGDLLVQQDTSSEEAELRAIETTMALAKINLDRFKGLLAEEIIPRSQYDSAEAAFKQAVAQSDNIRTVIAKKNIRAPFAGRLGLRLVNLGQVLKEGEPIVSLAALDSIYVNFLIPQQQLGRIRPGLPVRVTTDALPGQKIEGKITAIHPEVDPATRNIRLQATLANPGKNLKPGMFANVAVIMPAKEKVLVIPAPAILYAPYGDSVFVVEEQKNEKTGQPGKIVRQQFVRLDKKRGDFVVVVSGLQEGETIVSTGVFKLRNGQSVVEDNTLAPEFELSPKPEDT